MKKTTLFLFALFVSWQINAQVGIIQSFPNNTTPPGWSLGGASLSSTNSCATSSWRANLYGSDTEKILTSDAQVSNGEDLTINFVYKVVNYSGGAGTSPYNGTITTEVSLDGGTTWGINAGLINNANHVVATTCKSISYVLPAASVPSGSNVKVRWKCNFFIDGDYWVYIDNISATQPTSTPPLCTFLTTPANNALNVLSTIISWNPALGIPSGYKLRVGTAIGASDILNNFNVGDVLSYDLGSLDAGTTYFVTVIPYNSNGDATGCSETSFTVCDILLPDFIEQFNTFLPDCWANKFGGNLTTGPTASTGSGWVVDGFANIGSSGAIRNNIYTTGANDWVISPVVNIPATGYELKFDAAATQNANVGIPTTPWESDDYIQVLVTATGTNNWTVLHTYNNTNQPSNAGSPLIINLDAFAGQEVRFAFRAVEGASNGDADIDFSIDNFEVRMSPTSVPLCASNIVATPSVTCGNAINTITWDAVASADGYRINIGTTSGGTTILNNVNIGNVLTYSFLGNIASTYYYTITPFNAAGIAVGCAEMSFVTVATGCYCEPVYSDGISYGDLISKVEILTTTLSNTSGPGTTGPSYTYFSGQPNYTATLQAGSSYTMQTTVSVSDNQNVAVWIDYNNDYSFDPSERVGFTTTSIPSNGVGSFSITLACDAPVGVHRMRIKSVWNKPGNVIAPCANESYGEIEDYDITIASASSCPAPTNVLAANILDVSAAMSWNVGCSENSWNIEYGVAGFTQGTGSAATVVGNANYLLNGLLPSTAYDFYVASDCNIAGNGISTWVKFTFSTILTPPINDDCSNAIVVTMPYNNSQDATNATNNSGVISNCSPGMNDGVWYSVIGNGSNITVSISAVVGWDAEIGIYTGSCGAFTCVGNADVYSQGGNESYTIVNSVVGTIYYINVGHYDASTDNPEGPFTIDVSTTLSSNSFDNASFMAYPNPVKDVFNLSYTSEIFSLRVLNLLGQEVISRTVNANSTQVDMSQLSAGTYIINVKVADSVKSIKVIKQ